MIGTAFSLRLSVSVSSKVKTVNMRSFESTVFIAAEPQQIWSVLANVSRWRDWTPTITSIDPLDSESLGARYKVRQPKLPPAIWSVTQLNPSCGFTWGSRRPGIRTVADHVIAPVSAKEVKVTLRVVFSGLLCEVVGLLAGSLTQRYLALEAACLKKRVESQPPTSHV